ncbi:MAG: aminotransferase class V-fold PLP-dependent enzyme [Candidatus Riflebacteria bacterium]|nr:aminotransferase class V-fold PLP-dependent enzyme [Candidatus Riflebacteria bacterium]
MKKRLISLIPGPVSVSESVLAAACHDFGSPDLDRDFLELYNQTESRLQKILGTKNSIIIQTGEGMLGLWGALKSCLRPGDRVVAVCSGVFGYGIADMAEAIGAEVKRLTLPYDQTFNETGELERLVAEFKPLMITAVHCETPSGTLNPLAEIARIKREQGVQLLCVDTVASAGGVPVEADKYQIDLCLNGSQKCLSAPPNMTFVGVSQAAWEIISEVNYVGYDAFKPFKSAQDDFYFPNTMYWHGTAALNAAAGLILDEGLDNVYRRHIEAMYYCIERSHNMGLELYAAADAIKSPTVTALKVPQNVEWNTLQRLCRENGLAIAGSYGCLADKVMRIGHMGTQADLKQLKPGMDILEKVLHQ